MTVTSVKSQIGKEDLSVQTNKNATETFTRKTSSGGSLTLEKVPDVWDGTGLLNAGKLTIRALDDNDTILHSFGGS